MMKRLLPLLLIFIMGTVALQAQSLSDEQVIEYVKTATSAGKTQRQIMTELAQKGVKRAQVERIRKKYEEQQAAQPKMGAVDKNRMRTEVNVYDVFSEDLEEEMDDTQVSDMENPMEMIEETPERLVFGRNIFNSKNLTFAPSQNIATPTNYKLGPGDEVIIDVWGSNQTTIREMISPDGNIKIQDIGLVYLNGMTVQEADRFLRNKLSKIHSIGGMDGEYASEMKLSLGQIRTIQIHVMGEVMLPGTYALSSLSTVFHALYQAGGVNELGSLRAIHVMRNGKKVGTVDVYDFILKGKTMEDIRLQEGDVIIVPPYEQLVNIEGNVKRPMFYEMKQGETVKDLIEYAGNFTGNAYRKNVTMTRQNGREYQIYTIDDLDYSIFQLMDGDALSVNAMLDRYENRIEIKGAVYRPGVYQYSGQLNTVGELIRKAEGLKGDAFSNRAVLHREHEDLTLEVIPVNVKGVMEGSVPDIALQRNDVLYVPSIHDLQDIGNITIYGEVARPGVFPFADNTSLEDLIIQAGGLLESASTVRVDVSRRIKDSKGTETPSEIGEMFTFSLKDGFVIDGEQGFKLQPYDQVYVRKSPAYVPQVNVRVQGEILYAGTYALTQKTERVSDLVKKAGGVTPYAYVKGARLTRTINADERKRMEAVLDMAKSGTGKDTINIEQLELGNVYYVGIDLEKAIANPGSDYDVVLREGDVLEIPEYNNTVRISGAVMYPNTVTYQEGKTLKHYIEQAGGYGFRAKKSKAYVVYMNGQVAKASKMSHSVIQPGCEIIVPNKEKNEFKLQNILSIATTSASLATMIASIANILK